MNTTLVTFSTQSQEGHTRLVTVPIFIPDLDQVRTLALQLHKEGKPYHNRVWGWQVTYEPELRQEQAPVQVPDGEGGFNLETRPIWSPASFTIGENGIWFFSLLWEEGTDHAPVEFLEERDLLGY